MLGVLLGEGSSSSESDRTGRVATWGSSWVGEGVDRHGEGRGMLGTSSGWGRVGVLVTSDNRVRRGLCSCALRRMPCGLRFVLSKVWVYYTADLNSMVFCGGFFLDQ